MDQLVSILPLVLIAVVFWLFMVRPTARRQKALRELQSALQPGDRVILSSGILGTVESVGSEDLVQVQIADGVVIEVMKSAIMSSSRAGDPTLNGGAAESTETAEPEASDDTPPVDR